MTPKEKAKEIYANYGATLSDHNFRSIQAIKKCANLAINEVIYQWDNESDRVAKQNYWKEVKQELEKL